MATFTPAEMQAKFPGNPHTERKARFTPKQMEDMAEKKRTDAIRGEQSIGDKFSVAGQALGHSLGQYSRGVQKIYQSAFGSEQDLANLKEEDQRAESEFADTEISKTNPIINFAADPANLLGGSSVGRALVAGALASGSRYGDNQLGNAALGGVVGAGFGKLAEKGSRVVEVAAGRRANVDRDMPGHLAQRAQLLEKEGFSMTPGQRTQGSGLLSMEKRQSGNMISAPLLQDVNRESQDQLNKVVLSRFGVDSNVADEKSIKSMVDNIGAKFDEFEAIPGTVSRDKNYHEAVISLRQKYKGRPKILKKLNTELASMRNGNPGGFSMKELMSNTSALRQLARASKSKPKDQAMYNELADTLYDSAERQLLTPDQTSSMAKARQLYKESLSVEDAAGVGAGDLSQNKLVTGFKKRDKTGFNRSTDNPLYETTKAYNAIIGNQAKDFPAPSNLMLQAMTAPIVYPAGKAYLGLGGTARSISKNLFGGEKSSIEKAIGHAGSILPREYLMEEQ